MSGFSDQQFCTEHGIHSMEMASPDREFEDGLGNPIDADEYRRELDAEDASEAERVAELFPGTRDALSKLTIWGS